MDTSRATGEIVIEEDNWTYTKRRLIHFAEVFFGIILLYLGFYYLLSITLADAVMPIIVTHITFSSVMLIIAGLILTFRIVKFLTQQRIVIYDHCYSRSFVTLKEYKKGIRGLVFYKDVNIYETDHRGNIYMTLMNGVGEYIIYRIYGPRLTHEIINQITKFPDS